MWLTILVPWPSLLNQELFCWNFSHKGSQIELLKASWGQKAKPRTCHQTSPATPIDLGEFLPSRGPQNILRFLSLPGSDLPYSPGKAAGTPVNKVPGWYFQGLYWLQKVNLYSLKLCGHVCVCAHLWSVTLQSKPWSYNQCVQLCPITRRTDPHWITQITILPYRIFTKFPNVGGIREGEKIIVSILLTKL